MASRSGRGARGSTGRDWTDRMEALRRRNREHESLSVDDLRQREQERIDVLNRDFLRQQERAREDARAQQREAQRAADRQRFKDEAEVRRQQAARDAADRLAQHLQAQKDAQAREAWAAEMRRRSGR